MTTRIPLAALLLVILLVGHAFPARPYAQNCDEATNDLKKSQARLEELSSLNRELDGKFDEYVRADFNIQSEGLLNQVHRNAALKVAFARKRLSRAIANQEAKLRGSEDSYCSLCKTKKASDPKTYCTLCPSAADCTP